MNDINQSIASRLVPETECVAFVDRLFGIKYVRQLEPAVFQFAKRLATDNHGDNWSFYELSNGGFYIAPRTDAVFAISSLNGREGEMTADALGITACLYAYSHLSFGNGPTGTGSGVFAEICGKHYYLLREFMFGHTEVQSILRAIN
jgi:hypothetical protein